MSPLPVTPPELVRHEHRLALLVAGALGLFVVEAAAGFFLPRRPLVPGLSSIWVTAAALALGLFLSLHVEKVAARRVVQAREAYVASGDVGSLLGDHVRIYLTVLAMLQGIGVLGLLVAVSGAGPRAALWFHGAGAILTALAWPTDHKVRLYLDRAETLRRREQPPSRPTASPVIEE